MSLIEGTYHTLSQRILHRETQQLASLQYAVKLQSKKAIDRNKFQIENAAAVVNLLSKKVIDQHKNQIDHAASMLKMLCKQCFTKNNNDLKHLSVKLTLLEPANILKRGFSITYYQGKPVVDAAQLASQDEIETQFFSGKVKSRVE
jgi:exodeoxyribonuclease VII large subunit